jgi:5'-3' exonuclease
MMNYIIVDTANLFFKSKYSTIGDIDSKIGMSLHIMFKSIAKAVRDHGGDETPHVVFTLEGKGDLNWRKAMYSPYKMNRHVARALAESKMSNRELEEEKLMFDAYGEFKEFLTTKTNCTVLYQELVEGDDFVARWIQTHPDDNHAIISTDTDFIQLVTDNVCLYDGMKDITYRKDGIYNPENQRLDFTIGGNAKIKTGDVIDDDTPHSEGDDWIEWYMFMKCIRGDSSDNVFSAYPGVRVKGTKNKVGIRDAYLDRINKGYDWNNFMLQTWMDHDDKEHTVLEDYERNVNLIDLTKHPDDIKEALDATIIERVQDEPKSGVGLKFMQFCGEYNLPNIAGDMQAHATYLNKGYK